MEKVRALRTTSRQYTPPGDELENGMGKRLLRMPLMNEAHAVDQRLSDESRRCCAVDERSWRLLINLDASRSL
jgi:hypothetical protein